jgi:hypothetical protein
MVAADKVSLVLPETGICEDDFVDGAAAGCCKPTCCGKPSDNEVRSHDMNETRIGIAGR